MPLKPSTGRADGYLKTAAQGLTQLEPVAGGACVEEGLVEGIGGC